MTLTCPECGADLILALETAENTRDTFIHTMTVTRIVTVPTQDSYQLSKARDHGTRLPNSYRAAPFHPICFMPLLQGHWFHLLSSAAFMDHSCSSPTSGQRLGAQPPEPGMLSASGGAVLAPVPQGKVPRCAGSPLSFHKAAQRQGTLTSVPTGRRVYLLSTLLLAAITYPHPTNISAGALMFGVESRLTVEVTRTEEAGWTLFWALGVSVMVLVLLVILGWCSDICERLGKLERRVRKERGRKKEQEKSRSAEILPCPKSC